MTGSPPVVVDYLRAALLRVNAAGVSLLLSYRTKCCARAFHCNSWLCAGIGCDRPMGSAAALSSNPEVKRAYLGL